jgi:hypothetical protein
MNGYIGCPTDIGSILDRSYFCTEKHEQKEHELNRLQCDSFIKFAIDFDTQFNGRHRDLIERPATPRLCLSRVDEKPVLTIRGHEHAFKFVASCMIRM